MQQEQKPVHRIVSKREYVYKQTDRAISILVGVCMIGLSVVAVLVALLAFVNLFFHYDNLLLFSVLSGAIFLAGLIAFVLVTVGSKLIRDAHAMNPGVPFTRANTARMPAEESLVRAAEEPEEPQESVLLRAATHHDITPAEQLVRPVGLEK